MAAIDFLMVYLLLFGESNICTKVENSAERIISLDPTLRSLIHYNKVEFRRVKKKKKKKKKKEKEKEKEKKQKEEKEEEM
jgi:hypothetical protein